MDHLSRLSILVLALLVGGAAFAQTCPGAFKYKSNQTPVVAWTLNEYCSGELAWINANAPPANWQQTHCVGSGGAASFKAARNGVTNETTRGSSPLSSGGECPPASVPCSGLSSEGVGDVFTSKAYPGADGYCNPISHCKMSVSQAVSVDGLNIYTVKHTDQNCGGDAPAPSQPDLQPEACLVASGAEVCLTNRGENCGFVNDNFVCFPKIEDDGCKVFSDGARVCGQNAPMPPVPDNGTQGQPATPTETINSTVNNITTVMNYYNSNTVANSNRSAGTSGDNPYDGDDDGDGAGGVGDEEGEEEGSASGGDTCDALPTCEGNPIQCAILAQQWRSRCPETLTEQGIEGAVGEADAIPHEEVDVSTLSETVVTLGGGSGSCPAPPVIHLPGGGSIEITVITWFCELAAKIAPMVMIGAYLAAAFIVLGVQREG